MRSFQKLLPILVSYIGWLYIQLLGRTSRFEALGVEYTPLVQDDAPPLIFTFWHSRLLMPLYFFRNKRVSTLVSKSKDGELITQLMYRCGLLVSRGSASRAGAEGLRGLLRYLKQGTFVAITPDGPRGPREVISQGAIQLARLSGRPIFPVTFSCSRGMRFNSWDRFMLPFPFGTIRMVVGDPVEVPRNITEEQFEEKRVELEREMHRITKIADEIFPEKEIRE